MARGVVSELADADTSGLLETLAREAGYSVAARYAQEFEALYDRLSIYPESYQARPNLGAYVRAAVVRPYVVIYRHAASSDWVEIVRIVHGNRHITRRLLQGGKASP